MTPTKEDSQSSETGTVGGSNATLTKDGIEESELNETGETEEVFCDVDMPIPVQDEDYEAVMSENEVNGRTLDKDQSRFVLGVSKCLGLYTKTILSLYINTLYWKIKLVAKLVFKMTG